MKKTIKLGIISFLVIILLCSSVGYMQQRIIMALFAQQQEETINAKQCGYDDKAEFNIVTEHQREKVQDSISNKKYVNLALGIYDVENFGKDTPIEDIVLKVNDILSYVQGTKHEKAEMIAQLYLYGQEYMTYLDNINDTHSIANSKRYYETINSSTEDNEITDVENTKDYFFGRQVLSKIGEGCTFKPPTGEWDSPLDDYYIISDFMEYRWGTPHYGIDMTQSGIFGKPIYAVTNAIVDDVGTQCDSNNGYLGNMCNQGSGNFVTLKVQLDVDVEEYIYIHYCHMSAVNVSVGEEVVTGQEIGQVGNSGNTTGAHLHFEMRSTKNFGFSDTSDLIDPHIYIDF